MNEALVDTSILTRLANTADTLNQVADRAIFELHRRGVILRIAPQNLIEFRSVVTRPLAANGLGLSPASAEALADGFESVFPILPETGNIYPSWKALVRASGVIGKQLHDARLVALCHVYGIPQILTFNVQHFVRFASYGPGLAVIDPATL